MGRSNSLCGDIEVMNGNTMRGQHQHSKSSIVLRLQWSYAMGVCLSSSYGKLCLNFPSAYYGDVILAANRSDNAQSLLIVSH